jgi:epsilon-lactone hydrolase
MLSWQGHVLRLYMRGKRILSNRSGALNVEKERLGIETVARLFRPLTPVHCSPVIANDLPAEWIVPVGVSSERVVLYLHGGSFHSGSAASHRSLAANVAAAGNARALIVEYRLAPEHPFPGAVHDTLAAYEWLLATGVPADQIAVAGDSAGGALALALLVRLRDQGKPLPALAVCLSPVTDLTMSGPSWTFNAGKDVMLDPARIRASFELYLHGADPRAHLASPLYADLGGLPPLLIQVGAYECLLSDATRLAARAGEAGVTVTLDVWDRMQHAWQFTASFLPEGRQAIARIGEFISQVFYTGESHPCASIATTTPT